MKHPEADFSRELEDIARLVNCEIIPIPDIIPFKERRQRGAWAGKKRPFDCILSTQTNNIAIELKMNYNPLKEHQKEFLFRIAQRNGKAFVLRMIDKTKKTKYRIDQIVRNGVTLDKEVVKESENLLDIFKFLKKIDHEKSTS